MHILLATVHPHAGGELPHYPNCYPESVHPHAGGELANIVISRSWGSSPRRWGTRKALPFILLNPGSSPRRWGTRQVHESVISFLAVHPHAGGELLILRNLRAFVGSSPRRWGTRSQFSGEQIAEGSSPRRWGTPKIGSDATN